MIKGGLVAVLLAVGLMAVGQDAPYAEINNGVVRVGLYLPDTAVGYYRATRFDWSGVMPVVEYKGHRFVTQWFPKYGPKINDAILGPVESFTPVGYGVFGDRFVAIGVGVLQRIDTMRYNPFKYYPIVDAGKWTVKKRRRSVVFVQRLKQYVYEKDVVLDGAGLRLVHHLKNTGSTVIETDVFDHNFFRMDSTMTGPGFRIDVPGDSVVLREPITKVYGEMHGKGEYDIRMENPSTGIHIRCDRPLSKLIYWGSPTILCPEPYLHILVAPGETYTWTIYYEFYVR
jgi:hypothetical protein